MKKMVVDSFKTNWRAVLDEVQAEREAVVITKHSKPTKLVPVNTDADKIYNFLAGKPSLATSFSPALSREERTGSSDGG